MKAVSQLTLTLALMNIMALFGSVQCFASLDSVNGLTIQSKRFDEIAGSIRVSVMNVSDHPVVAWRVALVVADRTGNGGTAFFTEDYWSMRNHGGVLKPHEERILILPLGNRATPPHAASVRVTAIMYETGTGEGHPNQVEFLRSRRAARLRALEEIHRLIDGRIHQPEQHTSHEDVQDALLIELMQLESYLVGQYDPTGAPAISSVIAYFRSAIGRIQQRDSSLEERKGDLSRLKALLAHEIEQIAMSLNVYPEIR